MAKGHVPGESGRAENEGKKQHLAVDMLQVSQEQTVDRQQEFTVVSQQQASAEKMCAKKKAGLLVTMDNSVERLRSKSWAEPLGKSMAETAKVVGIFAWFLPGGSLIAGALTIGATLLTTGPGKRETKESFEGVDEEMKVIIIETRKTQEFNNNLLTKIQHQIELTFKIVADSRYKVRMMEMFGSVYGCCCCC
jgi:hypothetical protein